MENDRSLERPWQSTKKIQPPPSLSPPPTPTPQVPRPEIKKKKSKTTFFVSLFSFPFHNAVTERGKWTLLAIAPDSPDVSLSPIHLSSHSPIACCHPRNRTSAPLFSFPSSDSFLYFLLPVPVRMQHKLNKQQPQKLARNQNISTN